MKDKMEFHAMLTNIANKPVSEYARLIGDFDFSRYVLKISHTPEDVRSKPSLFIVRVPQQIAGFPPHVHSTPVRRTALEDYLTRRVASRIESLAEYDFHGISRRHLSIASPGQKILPRTSMLVTEEFVEARIYVSLPHRDGIIDMEQARDIFFNELPNVVNSALIYCNLDAAEVDQFVDLMEDADQIRQLLPTRGLVSFIAEGSYLKRLGRTDYPNYEDVRPISIASDLQVEMEVPNGEVVKGLGIPTGVTLILGDAYSGRVELMRAIAAGIYNHVAGDGRESVITVPDAVHIAAEEGRSVQKVDVSPFIQEVSGVVNPQQFTVTESDPCTAQAAATVEALEVGARVLLFDESVSSPAFLTRDTRLNVLMPDAGRIRPLSACVRQLVDDLGISVVVAGASSIAEFIPVADTILRVDGFTVHDITSEAKALEMSGLTMEPSTVDLSNMMEKNRWVVPTSIDPSMGHLDDDIESTALDLLRFGRSVIALQDISQLADRHQTETIGLVLSYAKQRYMEEGRPVREIMDLIDRDLSTEGLECLSRDLRGDLARPRRYEIAAALNRLDTLRISHVE